MTKKLYRSKNNRMIAGVCGGLAHYLDIDPTIIRIIAVVIGFATAFTAFIAYIVCAIIIPEDITDENSQTSAVDNSVKTKQVLGIILIVIGAMIFFEQFVWWIDKGVFAGAAIIGLGGLLLYFGTKEKKESENNIK